MPVLALVIGLAIVVLGFAAGNARSAIHYVNPGQSIQEVIDNPAVVDGDEIIAPDRIYIGNGNRDIDFLGKAITLRSENGPENCIIDCENSGRGFLFHNNEDANSVLDGFTITNGWPDSGTGGGIRCSDESNPTITNCIISGNSASQGAGIDCYSSSPTIMNCVIIGNVAYWSSGGGMVCRRSSPTITNCIFIDNWAYQGGGMSCGPDSNPTLTNCIFSGNSAKTRGGGMSNGGDSTSTLTNCTFSGNEAGDYGGGMYIPSGSATLINCILWGDAPEEIYLLDGSITVTYSDVQGGWSGLGNINADPNFIEPGYWNGDIWVNGDYHLKSEAGRWEPVSQSWVQDDVTSPCIDAGNPGCPLGSESNDVNNVRRNMGAYGGTAEASRSPANWALLADLTNDHKVDVNDLEVFVGYWLDSGECIPSDLNRNKFVDFNDFAIFANDRLGEGGKDAHLINECDDWQVLHPEWIFCDDFESDTPLVRQGRYFEYNDDGGDFIRIDGAGLADSNGMRVLFQAGEVAAGTLHLGFGRVPSGYFDKGIRNTEDFREIYYRMYLKMQDGWQGNPLKLSRASVFVPLDWCTAATAFNWQRHQNNPCLAIEARRCVDINDEPICGWHDDCQWLGYMDGITPIFDSEHDDTWFCVEHHIRLNDPGMSNGVQEFWIDGQLEARLDGLDFVRSYTDYAINAVFFENYWNSGSPQIQERYFDNIVVSTELIGCGD